MKVATIQFAPKFKAREANIRSMVAMAEAAAQSGANLIVLPEMATTGYSFMGFSDAIPHAECIDTFPQEIDKHFIPLSLMAMQTLVDKYAVAIAWGTMTVNTDRTQLYNSQVLMTPNTLVSYNKVNSWGNDYLWATEGSSSPPIVTFMGKRVGLLICRDVRDKGSKGSGLEDFYEKGDADLVCFSSNFGKGGFPPVSWINFAKDNETWFIVSNRYGLEEHNDFGLGGICVVEPSGKVQCEGLLWDKPCIVYADIP
jgi:predicted amidohydrolase